MRPTRTSLDRPSTAMTAGAPLTRARPAGSKIGRAEAVGLGGWGEALAGRGLTAPFLRRWPFARLLQALLLLAQTTAPPPASASPTTSPTVPTCGQAARSAHGRLSCRPTPSTTSRRRRTTSTSAGRSFRREGSADVAHFTQRYVLLNERNSRHARHDKHPPPIFVFTGAEGGNVEDDVGHTFMIEVACRMGALVAFSSTASSGSQFWWHVRGPPCRAWAGGLLSVEQSLRTTRRHTCAMSAQRGLPLVTFGVVRGHAGRVHG